MSEVRPVVLISTYRADLDPAQVWAVAADPARLGEWSPFGDLTGTGEVISHGDRFGAAVSGKPVQCRVTTYDAGRRFVVEAEADGRSVAFECRVESVVASGAPATEITLRSSLPESSGMGWLARRRQTRQLRRCLARLLALVR